MLVLKACFVGLQLQGANGYLVDLFVKDGVNKRIDKDDGNVNIRCRSCLEVINTLISLFETGRIILNWVCYWFVWLWPMKLMKYLVGELRTRNLAFAWLTRHRVMKGMGKNHKNKMDSGI